MTLGDSFATGAGIYAHIMQYQDFGGFLQNVERVDNVQYKMNPGLLPCAREPDSTPGAKLARDQGIESEMVACSGATVENLLSQIDYINTKFPEERARDWSGSTIILTIGINSLKVIHDNVLLWVMLPAKCVLDIFRDCSEDPEFEIANLEEVQEELRFAFQYLLLEASEATIRVTSYVKPFQRGSQDCQAVGVNNAEADFIDDRWFGLLNDALAEVIADVKGNSTTDMEYVEVNSYVRVGACQKYRQDVAVRGYDTSFPLPYSPVSYHPNQLGYDQCYAALVDSLPAR